MSQLDQRLLPLFQEHCNSILKFDDEIMKEMREKYLNKLKSCKVFSDDQNNDKQNELDNSTNPNSPIFDNSQIDNNFKMLQIDIQQFTNSINTQEFSQFSQKLWKICMHMQLNTPPIRIDLPLLVIQKQEKYYPNLVERDFDYRAWEKNNFICIDGPQVDSNPCIVIMPPPLLNSGYVYQGIKPGVLILEQSTQSQAVRDLVKESKQARIRQIEKQKLNKKRNDILSDIVDVPKNIDLEKINQEEEQIQEKKSSTFEDESKQKINDSSILPRKIEESSILCDKKQQQQQQQQLQNQQSLQEQEQFRFTPSLNASNAVQDDQYATAGFKQDIKLQQKQQEQKSNQNNICIPSPYLKSTQDQNNNQIIILPQLDSLPQTPKQFPNVDQDQLLIINPTKSFMLGTYSRQPKAKQIQASLNIYAAVRTQQSRIQEEQHLSQIPKQLNTPPTIGKFSQNNNYNNNTSSNNLATTINMFNDEQYQEAIPNQSESSLIPKTSHPSTASRKGKIKTITSMNKNNTTSSSPCLHLISRQQQQYQVEGEEEEDQGTYQQEAKQKRFNQQLLNSKVIIQNLDLQTRESCTVQVEQNNSNETHLYQLRQFQTKQLRGNKTPYPSEQKKNRKMKQNGSSSSKFFGIISTTPSSSTPYNTKTINTCTNKTYNLLRSVTQEEQADSAQINHHNEDNYKSTPSSQVNRNQISRLYYKGVRDKSIMQRLNFKQSSKQNEQQIQPYRDKIIHLREKLVQIQQKGKDILPVDSKNKKSYMQLNKKSKNSSSYKSFHNIMRKSSKQRDSSSSINFEAIKNQNQSSKKKPMSSIKIQKSINGTWHAQDQPVYKERESSSSLRSAYSKMKQQYQMKKQQKQNTYFNEVNDDNTYTNDNDDTKSYKLHINKQYSKTPSARNKIIKHYPFHKQIQASRHKQSAFKGTIQSFVKNNNNNSSNKKNLTNRSPSADRVIASNYKNTQLYMQNVSKIINNRYYKNDHDISQKSQTPSSHNKRDKHQIQSKMAQYGRILNRDASSGKLASTGRKINEQYSKQNTNTNICDNTKKKQFISSSFIVPTYSLTSRASQCNQQYSHHQNDRQKEKKMENVRNIQNQMLYKKFSKKNVEILNKRDSSKIRMLSSSSSSSQQQEYIQPKRQKSTNRLSRYELKAEKAGAAIILQGRNAIVGLNSDRSCNGRNKLKNSSNNINNFGCNSSSSNNNNNNTCRSPFDDEQEKLVKKVGLYNSFAWKH